jgi:hypothetical protein
MAATGPARRTNGIIASRAKWSRDRIIAGFCSERPTLVTISARQPSALSTDTPRTTPRGCHSVHSI